MIPAQKPENKMIEAHDSARFFLIAVLSNLVVQLVFNLILSGVNPSAELSTLISFFGSLVIQSAYMLVYFFLIPKNGLRIPYHFKNKLSPVSAVLSGAAAVCLLAALYLPSMWFEKLLNLMGFAGGQLTFNTANLIVCIFVTVIFAPLIEEFVFRAVVLGGLKNNGIYKAVFLTALCFSLSHFNPSQTFYQFFIGALCALLVVFTGSLWAGVTAHAVNNLIVVLMSVTPVYGLLERVEAYVLQNSLAAVFLTFGFLLVFGTLTAFLIWLVKRHSGKKSPVKNTEENSGGLTQETDSFPELIKAKRSATRTYLLLGYGVSLAVWITVFVSTILV